MILSKSPEQTKLMITLLFVLVSLGLFYFFPVRSVIEETTAAVFFLLVIPLSYSKIVLHLPLSRINIQSPRVPVFLWLLLLFVLWSVGAGLAALLFFFTPFLEQYSLPVSVADSFWFFSVYQLLFVGLFVLLYEVFFRGFLMEILRPIFSWGVLIIVPILFFLYLWIFSGLSWNILPLLLAGILSTVFVYISRSVFLGILLTLPFLLVFDAVVLAIER